MHTIDTPNAVDKQFVNRNEITKKPGTIIDASIMNAMQNEIVNVILGADIQLDKAKHDQLKTAINKYVSDLEVSLTAEINRLDFKDASHDLIISQIRESVASLGGGTTNYGSSTLIKTYTFTEPNANNYYTAPHTNGFSLVYLNGILLRKTQDWTDANNGEGIALNFSWTNTQNQSNELEIICFVSGDMIKVTTQVPIGTAFDWYGPEDKIPLSYIKMVGQTVSTYAEHTGLAEIYPVSLPNTKTQKSVKIVKAYDYTELGEDFSNRYYGPRSEDPLTNISGGLPTAGDCYYNTSLNALKYYDGTRWETMEFGSKFVMLSDSNTQTTVNKYYLMSANGVYFLPNTWNLTPGDTVIFASRHDIDGASVRVNNDTTDLIKVGSDLSDNQINFSAGFKLTFVYLGLNQWQVVI